jgi:hypothetical protein
MIYDKGIKKITEVIIKSGNQSLNDIEFCHNRITEDGVINLHGNAYKMSKYKIFKFLL